MHKVFLADQILNREGDNKLCIKHIKGKMLMEPVFYTLYVNTKFRFGQSLQMYVPTWIKTNLNRKVQQIVYYGVYNNRGFIVYDSTLQANDVIDKFKQGKIFNIAEEVLYEVETIL